MKLYLAARFSKLEETRNYANELKKDGHQITASWVYGGEEGKSFEDIAILDVKDVHACEGLVSFTEPYGSVNSGGGRHSEFGLGLALRKELFIVGEREQIFHWYPGVLQFPKFMYLQNYLKGK